VSNSPPPSPAASAAPMPGQQRPSVAVVVASFREVHLLEACLGSLREQCARYAAGLIVARAGTPQDVLSLAAKHSYAHFVTCEPGSQVPLLRAAGMAAANADVVMLTEDHCIASSDWIEQLVRGCRGERDVAGGPMANAQGERAVDWAAFFAEYGFFVRASAGEVPAVTGANVAYGSAVVKQVAQWAQSGSWENVVHARLRAAGSPIRFVESAVIAQNGSYSFRAFCHDRYEHGRDYARTRVALGGTSRWLFLALTPLLPFLLTFRVARLNVAARTWNFFRSLPLTFGFLVAWSAGEFVGYWQGPAGSSASRG
jgi:GT2 family glycosyltransferase